MTHLFSVLLLSSSLLFANSSDYDIELFCQDINIILQKTNLISENIANANTTRSAKGGPYKRKVTKNCHKGLCEVIEIENNNILKYEPDHPDAQKNGYVAYPNINVHEEMVEMIKAQRAYELIVANAPIESMDLLVGTKLQKCFETYTYFEDGYNFKKYFGR